MKFAQLKKVTAALVVLGVVLLTAPMFLDLPLLSGLGLAALAAAFALERKFHRCPHCHQYLRELPAQAEKCPKCGGTLEG